MPSSVSQDVGGCAALSSSKSWATRPHQVLPPFVPWSNATRSGGAVVYSLGRYLRRSTRSTCSA
eukprot:10202278-Lingulodinium_polyedra.AAC.1